jgi:chemosensory pili system protein ChpA (sensor histidine kinase/response regulator)
MALSAGVRTPVLPRVVVIVDDDDSIATTIEIALHSLERVAVVVFPNSIEAFSFFAHEPPTVSALITDLHMPRMSGFELIEEVRKHPVYRELPIVVISADSRPETAARVHGMDVEAYFTKPCSPVEIRRVIENLLGEG